MKYEYRFQHILNLKEREKDEAYNLYRNAVKQFEEAGEQLLNLLKKKENLEESQHQELSKGLSITDIKHYQLFIGNLEKTIDHCQKLVMNTRNQMNWHAEKLKENNIEVKKYEKMKEKNYQSFLQGIAKVENMQLDEISTMAFFKEKEIR